MLQAPENPIGRTSMKWIGLLVFSATVGIAGEQTARADDLAGFDCIVEPSAVVELGVAVPGLLDKVFRDQGDHVKADELMGELESEVELTSFAIARTIANQSTALELRRLTAAFGERTKERNESLISTSSISAQNMDQVETETAIAALQVREEEENQQLAKLEVLRARAILERRQIVSPIDGVVVRRYKSAGEYVDREPVFKIAQLHPLNVEVIVPVKHLERIERGMRASVNLLAPGHEENQKVALVSRVDALVDVASGTFGVRLDLPNENNSLPAGVRCEVSFEPRE